MDDTLPRGAGGVTRSGHDAGDVLSGDGGCDTLPGARENDVHDGADGRVVLEGCDVHRVNAVGDGPRESDLTAERGIHIVGACIGFAETDVPSRAGADALRGFARFREDDLRPFGVILASTRLGPSSVAFDEATGRYPDRTAGFAQVHSAAKAGPCVPPRPAKSSPHALARCAEAREARTGSPDRRPAAPHARDDGVAGSTLGPKWWRGQDSNLRRVAPTDLQSVAFDRSATPPGTSALAPEQARE